MCDRIKNINLKCLDGRIAAEKLQLLRSIKKYKTNKHQFSASIILLYYNYVVCHIVTYLHNIY